MLHIATVFFFFFLFHGEKKIYLIRKIQMHSTVIIAIVTLLYIYIHIYMYTKLYMCVYIYIFLSCYNPCILIILTKVWILHIYEEVSPHLILHLICIHSSTDVFTIIFLYHNIPRFETYVTPPQKFTSWLLDHSPWSESHLIPE